jgi:hypothetical protein
VRLCSKYSLASCACACPSALRPIASEGNAVPRDPDALGLWGNGVPCNHDSIGSRGKGVPHNPDAWTFDDARMGFEGTRVPPNPTPGSFRGASLPRDANGCALRGNRAP